MQVETLPLAPHTLRAANDNATPVVRAPRRRPDATYAASGNVILRSGSPSGCPAGSRRAERRRRPRVLSRERRP
jgi:hypothetical protein